MTRAAHKVLIVGGGIAGMSAAIELRKRGTQVDLVEIDPRWRVQGAGITLSGPTLRAFTSVGIIDDLMAEGSCQEGLDILDAAGNKIDYIPTHPLGRPDVPGSGGIMRPVLARILREHTLASGAAVRCGVTFESIEQDDAGVTVRFTDGRTDRYDLVIGADGLHSKVRDAVFPDAPKPYYVGQACWRAVVPRGNVERAMMAIGPRVKAGFNPVSKDEMYLFVTERRDTNEYLDESVLVDTLRDILSDFGGLVGELRDGLGPQSQVLFRPFWVVLQPRPWYRGRVLMIGDAVHATTPHLASGAGIGVEDAVVLPEELDRTDNLPAALEAFMDRRFERCRMVIENSVRLADLEREKVPDRVAHEQLMRSSMTALIQPI